MIKRHTISFKNAFAGILAAIKTQPNFRIHLVISVLVLAGAWYFKISYYEVLTIVALITIGLVIEMVNTAIEETTDAIDTSWRADIKMAKDVAAGAMLVFALGSAVIAGIIFLPRILQML